MRFLTPVGAILSLGLFSGSAFGAEKLIHDCADCPEVVVLSAGTLMMGVAQRTQRRKA